MSYRLARTAGILFFAAASVYPNQGISGAAESRAGQGKPAKNPTTDVRLLDETAGPVADAPATRPAQAQPVAAGQVSVSDAGTVEIHVNEANLVEVLRMLSIQSQKNIVASKEVRGTVTANLYNVTIKEALDAILKAYGFAYREKGNFIYVYSAKELADLEKAERQITTEVFRLHYTPAANAANVIKPALSTEGQVAMTTAAATGLESGTKSAGGDAHAVEDILVVRDYPDNIERVRKIVKEMDRRPQQVLVEATIVAARLTDDNNLGIDFNIVGGVDFARINNSNSQITGTQFGSPLSPGDNRASSVGTGDNFTSGLDPGFKVGVVAGNVSVFLNALEAVTDTAVLANPKVLTLNKQQGEVLVGREDGYLTTTVTDTTAIQTVEFLQTGTKLTFRPYIGDDGYIRMEVHPEDSDGRVVGGLPSKQTTEVTTNILVKDGHTVIIGGLFRESSTIGRRQVPGLGSLPVVGALFRGQEDKTFREEIIILLTPHIVKDDKVYAEGSEEALKDMEKLRVGVRRGMMFWSRERLSEIAYDAAVEEMNKPEPNRKKALWHLDCATNLNPKFVEAIKMKEGLTGHEVMSVDNSSIRHFVRKQILADRGADAPKAPATQTQAEADPVAPATQPVAEYAAEEYFDYCAVPESAQVEEPAPAEEAKADPMPMTAAPPQPAPAAPATQPAEPEQPSEVVVTELEEMPAQDAEDVDAPVEMVEETEPQDDQE